MTYNQEMMSDLTPQYCHNAVQLGNESFSICGRELIYLGEIRIIRDSFDPNPLVILQTIAECQYCYIMYTLRKQENE